MVEGRGLAGEADHTLPHRASYSLTWKCKYLLLSSSPHSSNQDSFYYVYVYTYTTQRRNKLLGKWHILVSGHLFFLSQSVCLLFSALDSGLFSFPLSPARCLPSTSLHQSFQQPTPLLFCPLLGIPRSQWTRLTVTNIDLKRELFPGLLI